MKPTPNLRRARKLASGVKGLIVKPLVSGALLWYWEPNAGERKAGWQPIQFKQDEAAALAGANARNAEIVAWRQGVPPPLNPERGVPALQPFKPAPETLAVAAQRYIREHLVHHSPGHQRTAKSRLNSICAFFGAIEPSLIDAAMISNWTDALRGRGTWTDNGRQVSDTTAHNQKRTLTALLNWIKNPHEKFAPTARDQLWEVDDEAAFIAAAYDLGLPSMAFAMKLAIYTGQRGQDMIAFTEHQLTEVKHLVSEDDTAWLADKQGKVWGWSFTQLKEQVPMHIPFEQDMLAELRTIINHNRARDRAAGRLLTHVLVNDRSGQPWKPRHFIRTWNEVKDHAIARTGRTNMDGLHWHDLRRTACVRLKRQGISNDLIGMITGHAPGSVDAMMKVYGPIDANMTARVIVKRGQMSRDAQRRG
jgi:integrase